MMYQLPDIDLLYKALLERDPRYEGKVVVGVLSTGIFCKLTCSARKPKLENCRFFESVPSAERAGFRACRICKPKGDNRLEELARSIQENPEQGWREADLRAKGFDPRTLRRQFERQFGISLSEMVRLYKMRKAMNELEMGSRVIEAQMAAGFSSAQGFRDAFSELLGLNPSELRAEARYKASWIETPLGAMIAVADNHALHLLEFLDRKQIGFQLKKLWKTLGGEIGIGQTHVHERTKLELEEFFKGQRAVFEVPIALNATGFTLSVWRALRQIPAGETRSYGELAKIIGQPLAFRAVANANARNPIAIIVPCHRVIGSNGRLTGYAGGIWRKEKLIEVEKSYQTHGKRF